MLNIDVEEGGLNETYRRAVRMYSDWIAGLPAMGRLKNYACVG